MVFFYFEYYEFYLRCISNLFGVLNIDMLYDTIDIYTSIEL